MRKKMRLLLSGVVAGGAIILLSGFFFVHAGAAGASGSPSFLPCASCHTMEKQVAAWKNGSHKDIACLQCHESQDPNMVRREFLDKGQEMAAANKQHTLALPVQDQTCTTCHAKEMADIGRDVNPANGKAMPVKAAHDLHVNGKPGLKCTDCHTIHSAATSAAQRKDAMHDLCQSCHDQKQVKLAVNSSVSCAACHVDPASVAPADHKDPAVWLKQHGKAVLGGQACGTCHLGPSAGAHTPIARTESFPTKDPDTCTTCHGGVTMPHEQSFLANHGAAYRNAPKDTCERCHGSTAPNSANLATSTVTFEGTNAPFCASCHAGQPMPHPAGYLKLHGADALKSPASCGACHSSQNKVNPKAPYARDSFCTNCHGGTVMPHPANYLTIHGKEAAKSTAVCEACHSPKNPANPSAAHASPAFCTNCHDNYRHPAGWVVDHGTKVTEACAACHSVAGKTPAGGQTEPHNACAACHTQATAGGKWHPDYWFITHSKAVAQQGKAGCMKCHDNGKLSCTRCHKNP